MFRYPYLLLKQRLEAIEGIPKVMWFNAQYDPEQDEAVYYVPAVYIEFLEVAMGQQPEQVQMAQLDFRVHLYTEYYDDDDQVMSHFDLATGIFTALSHWEGRLSDLPQFAGLAGTDDDRLILNRITRTAMAPDHAQTNTTATIQTFRSQVVDVDAQRAYEDAAPIQFLYIKPS